MNIHPDYAHLNLCDAQYLTILRDVRENGTLKHNRTGIDTKSVFFRSMRNDLQYSFPLVTTKKMWFKGIIHELIWMLGAPHSTPEYKDLGITNIAYLIDNNVHIWDDWAVTRYFPTADPLDKTTWENYKKIFLDVFKKNRLSNTQIDKMGDMGRIYGHQWRKFTGEDQQSGEKREVDQLVSLIHDLIHNPDSRRLKLTAWNPVDITYNNPALPSCHYDVNFYSEVGADNKRYLSCMFTMRSSDFFTAGNWNTAFYAALTCLLAKWTNHIPKEIVYCANDVHIYTNQFDGVNTQLKNLDNIPLPTLTVNVESIADQIASLKLDNKSPREVHKTRSIIEENIAKLKASDFVLENYKSYPSIKTEIAV